MESLLHAIDNTPIIDHHAHNLLRPNELRARQFLSITTEAAGDALADTPSTISHIRAVKQLSEILDCPPDWVSVEAAIAKKRGEPDDAWARRCFEGIETVLIDDGLDEKTVHLWDWHHRLTRSKCKRIVRIESLAESILKSILDDRDERSPSSAADLMDTFRHWEKIFISAIGNSIEDPDVVGFKSIICYRTGLSIPPFDHQDSAIIAAMGRVLSSKSARLEDLHLSPHFVHLTASLISGSQSFPKPFQFHTGLGDNDITLSLSSPSHLQPFIKSYPKVPIVILHAGYPFSREAGYLASTYRNVYLDIGEVFPMVSLDGQESVVRQSLELCPSEKLTWSTDGHWFPETYLLAVVQIREALKQVLQDNVIRKSLTVTQAIKITQDIFFNTSNKIYDLKLSLKPLDRILVPIPALKNNKIARLADFEQFLANNPSVKYIRLQWLDYTATLRTRILPSTQALNLFRQGRSVGISKAVLGLLQHDAIVAGFDPVGEYELIPSFESLRLGERPGYATMQSEFYEKDGTQVSICPRTILRRIVESAAEHNIFFRVGFELEVVFMASGVFEGKNIYGDSPVSRGHAWSAAGALRNPKMMDVIDEILMALDRSQIVVQQFHPESAPGQYEFVTGPLAPLDSVDTLLATRDIIYAVAEKHSLRATFIPKPIPDTAGTGAHVHMSMSPEEKHISFYAAILKHLRAIMAFTNCNASSYERIKDSVWSGGRYVTWGTQNRETPLRKIEGSHWELKCMDGMANMYLAMAAILGTGLKGVLDGEQLTLKDCGVDPASLDDIARKRLGIKERLPASLSEALYSLDADPVLTKVLGKEAIEVYLTIKRAEMEMLEGMKAADRRLFLIDRY